MPNQPAEIIVDELDDEAILEALRQDGPIWQNPAQNQAIAEPIKHPQEFRIFWGGYDVDPQLYGKEKSFKCGHTKLNIDKAELELMRQYMKEGIPIIGICRGAQLLNVANGGILIQHIEDHTYSHYAKILDKHSVYNNQELIVSSTHHQAMVPTNKAEILARATFKVDGVHWDNVNQEYEYPHVNEVVYYPETKSLCIQPHPEWMDPYGIFVTYLAELTNRLFGFTIDWKNEEQKILKGEF